MSVLRERASACLYGIFIGDALAMPVHWYYSLSTLKQHFPNGALRCVVAVGERVGGDVGRETQPGGTRATALRGSGHRP